MESSSCEKRQMSLRRRQSPMHGKGAGAQGSSEDYEAELFLCCRTGQLSGLKRLVEDKKVGVNIQDEWGNCPLYLACLCGHPHVVEYLLERGATYDARSIEGKRCFLGALNERIRDILRRFDFKLKDDGTDDDANYKNFLLTLYERVPDYDVELIVGGESFLAHRCILMARSPYFQDFMATAEVKDGCIEVQDKKLSATIFGPLLQFIYTGRMEVMISHLDQTKDQALYLGLDELAKYLKGRTPTTSDTDYITISHKCLQEDLKKDMTALALTAIPSILWTQLPVVDQQQQQQQEKRMNPDICLSVQNRTFDCHKVFLYGRSEFFRILLIEKQDEIVPSFGDYRPMIKLDDDIPAALFAQILLYFYTDSCEISAENSGGLLMLSEKFGLSVLKKNCITETTKNFNPQTVIHDYNLAKAQQVPELEDNCIKYMADNFHSLSRCQPFLQFLHSELSPFSRGDRSSPFLDTLQNYLRYDARQAGEIKKANERLQLLKQTLVSIGIDVPVPMLKVPQYTLPAASPGFEQNEHRKSECSIL